MYFGRHTIKEDIQSKTLPYEWLEELTKTLNEVYDDQCKKSERFFDVFGEIYDEDFVVIISYIHAKDPMMSPISVFISHDIVESSKEFKNVLKNLVDLASLIIDDIVSVEDWNDYISIWTENEFKGSKFFYKITRENVSLTIQAEKILSGELEKAKS